MSKSFVRHGSTKVPVYGRGLCLLCYVVSDTFWEKLPCQNMSEKSGKNWWEQKNWQMPTAVEFHSARILSTLFFRQKNWKLFPISNFWHRFPILERLYNSCRFSIYFLISQISTFQTFPFFMYPNFSSFGKNIHSFYFDKVHLISTFITFHLLPSPFDLLVGAYSAPLHFQVV